MDKALIAKKWRAKNKKHVAEYNKKRYLKTKKRVYDRRKLTKKYGSLAGKVVDHAGDVFSNGGRLVPAKSSMAYHNSKYDPKYK